MQRESPMKQQAVKIVSTHQEESLLQSTAVVGAEEGAIDSIPGNEGRNAEAWVNARGGLCIFAVYFWHSEGWTPRNEVLLEAVLKHARTTGHPWLTASDANTCPEDLETSLWLQREQMQVVAPKEASTGYSGGRSAKEREVENKRRKMRTAERDK